MIIGLCGRIGVGKSTTGELLREHFGFAVVDVADPIREALLGLNPMIPISDGKGGYSAPRPLKDLVDEYGWDRAKKSPNVRRLLQRFGKDCVRDHLDNKHWERKTLNRILAIADHRDNPRSVVVTNLRFPEERTLVEEIWCVRRSVEHSLPDSVTSHATESPDIDKYAVETIENDGTIEELLGKIGGCLDRAKERSSVLRERYGKKIRRA